MSSRLLAAICGFCCIAGAGARAQAPVPTEYDVKAAYLYNFGKYVQWPPGDRRTAAFEVCVLGRDPFGPALDRVVSGAAIGGRPVVARRLESAADSPGCHILFVGAPDEREAGSLLATLEPTDVLTVGETPHFLDQGGMIQFIADGARVRFEVDLARARAAGLTLSSDLLRVATAVRQGGGR